MARGTTLRSSEPGPHPGRRRGRRPGRRPLTVGAAVCTAAAALTALTACGTPPYTFVSSSDGDVVVQVPSGWNRLDPAEVREARSEDQATGLGWSAYFDAASRPDAKHLSASNVAHPVLQIETVDLPEDIRTTLTGDQLRDAVLPVSEAARAQTRLSAAAAGRPEPEFRMIRESAVKSATAHGVRVTYAYDFGAGEEVFDQVAVTDAGRTRAYILVAHCSASCYRERGDEIAEVARSFTLKAR